MSAYGLKDYEVLTVLKFFTYHMDLDRRGQLMAEFPVIYNKLMGGEYVKTVNIASVEDCE